MDLWAYQRGVTLDFSRPGKPTDNPALSLSKGHSSKHSTASCAANAWTRTRSYRWKMLAKRWRRGANITTKSDRTARSGISPRSCWQTQPVQPAHRTWARRNTPDPSGPRLG